MAGAPTLLIFYEMSIGGQFKDHRLWTSVIEGETAAHDYGSKEFLIQEAKDAGWHYKVLRKHRNGTTSIIEQA